MAMAKQRMVSFGEAFAKFWTRWTLEGRSSRSEYWWAVLFRGLLIIGIKFIAEASVASGAILPQAAKVISLITWFAFLGPFACVTARRLHDIGKSGAWMWLWLIPDAINQILEFQGNQWLLNLQSGCFTYEVFFAIVGSVVGSIGLIILLLFTTKPSQRAVNAYGPIPNIPEGFGNICPNCETALPEIAVFCPACGTRVKAEVSKEKPSASPRTESPERESPGTIGEVKTEAPSSVQQRQGGEQQPQAEEKKLGGAEDEDTSGNILKVLIATVILVAVYVVSRFMI